MSVDELCYADMLGYKPDNGPPAWYIVRRIWHTVIWPSEERQPPTYRLDGFDLIESQTGTIRQVRASELQQQLDEGAITFHHPQTVRRLSFFH